MKSKTKDLVSLVGYLAFVGLTALGSNLAMKYNVNNIQELSKPKSVYIDSTKTLIDSSYVNSLRYDYKR